ncbi:hypothetical protein CVT26_012239 [Gymnopilus dilepis]|uniref:Uncharacterized protein n=1 Tax=Gymnopilus dilepis TaxID=231916 RepID=A0A409YQ80_9AGAR|nr:hypothetical protein CVT26_012239 [Gymnopilus dilepis]
MSEPIVPKLKLHHGSSAMAISQSDIKPKLATKMTYPPLTIHPHPKTDLWRKPPSTDIDNAPIYLLSTPIDLHSFHTARVTVSGNWSTLYDQGGLALFIPDEDIKKWVKTGIEFVNGKPFVSTVATSRWGDWSLVPLPENANGRVTIQVERETKGDERVESLWVYIINEETGEKLGIREITWWFRHDIPRGQEDAAYRCLLVGVFGARPTVPEGNDPLEVKIENFEVTLFED